MFEGADAGDGFDAANAGGDGAFADDFEHADVADAVYVRAAAQLLRVEAAWCALVGDGYHANVRIRVFVAEECQRAGRQRVVERSNLGAHFGVVADLVVDCCLISRNSSESTCAKCEKIEAHPLGSIQRSGLLDVRAENIAQRGGHEGRASVVAHDAVAAVRIRNHGDAVPNPQRLLRRDFVRDKSKHRIVRAGNFAKHLRLRIVVNQADIRSLPAGLRINHRSIQHHFARFASFQLS